MLDVFFYEAYGKLYENIENGQCEVFEFSCEYGNVRNIYLKRKVSIDAGSDTYYDVISPYGYGGPVILNTTDTNLLMKYYTNAWIAFCAEQNIISEFVRFHLFDNCDVREHFYGEVNYVSDNIVVNTTYPIEEQWMRFEHKVRKNVKKAQANGLKVIRDACGARLDAFLDIYYATMDRSNANSFYYFGRSYFEAINELLNGRYMYFHVLKDNIVVSTEIVLCSEQYAYSFLGGTNIDYYDFRPNDILKYDIICWCSETGRKAFILGGGYQKEDGIYRYKRGFSPNGDVPFYVGKVVHNQKMYDNLVNIRKHTGQLDDKSSFFPLYRA